jgi:hypothetical protein
MAGSEISCPGDDSFQAEMINASGAYLLSQAEMVLGFR